MNYELAAGLQPTNSMDIKKPFQKRNGCGVILRKNNGNTKSKIGKTDGVEDLPVYSRFPAMEGPALQ